MRAVRIVIAALCPACACCDVGVLGWLGLFLLLVPCVSFCGRGRQSVPPPAVPGAANRSSRGQCEANALLRSRCGVVTLRRGADKFGCPCCRVVRSLTPLRCIPVLELTHNHGCALTRPKFTPSHLITSQPPARAGFFRAVLASSSGGMLGARVIPVINAP